MAKVKPKTLTAQMRRGQEGINFIEKIVLSMKSSWTPTGSLEVGTDGYIELFDRATGAALGKIIAVQSKVVKDLANEKPNTFDYYCNERDVEYWLQGNMPVVIIVVNLETKKAYWVSIKDYFKSSEELIHTKITFDKSKDRFSEESYADLLQLSRDYSSGLYLGAIPKKETLYSNLLKVESFPDRLWVAPTDYRKASQIWPLINDLRPRISGDWLLHEKSIISFQDLTTPPWNHLCDQGACEDFYVGEWAYSEDLDRRRQFVELLNRALRDQLYPEVRYWGKLECFAFSCTPETSPLARRYRSVMNESTLTVVADYTKKNQDGDEFVLLRHLAFRGQFRLLAEQWYLEITPTYVFTWDGFRIDRFHESRLSKIKRIEGNRAVLSAILCWADTLKSTEDLYRTSATIRFGELDTAKSDLGIDDAGWLKGEPDNEDDSSSACGDLFSDIDEQLQE